ncbi:MAG: oligoendopeptidase F [Deltaproteobacteria bacterium CG2_30_43_15]|nr:MAG: oligoendopeptidase F [Deltaproteobacteria bacterium CG2_30_43_15]
MDERLKTEGIIWNLTDLYQGIEDPRIEGDIERLRQGISNFSKEYRGKVKDFDPKGLFTAVCELEELNQLLGKIESFAFLNYSTRSQDAKAGAFLQKVHELESEFQRDIVFFNLEWANLDNETSEKLLHAPEIEKYRHFLNVLKKYRPHQLSETEERVLAEKEPAGLSSWTKLFDKIISQKKFGERGRVEEEVLADLYNSNREVRKKASEELTAGLSEYSHILTHIFNTILTDHMITDRLRKYPEWISSRNLSNEVDEKTVNALNNAVRSRYDIPVRYYKLKKKMLGYNELFDYDRYAPLPFSSERVVPWEECREIVLAAFGDFSKEMKNIASMFFDKHWMHAPLMLGKMGGAFSHPCIPDVHPYIMLNYTGNIRDVQTVAHELGHGIHQYLAAKKQGYFNSQTPPTMAETASVFGEMLVFKKQLKGTPQIEEEISLLCSKLEAMFATVFRQISMYLFEDAIHRERRNVGELSNEKFNELWTKTQKEMFGDSVTLTENYSIWWSYIPHFLHARGYVYAYAFGELLTLSLYKSYEREGNEFIPKYISLLSSGGKASPANLVKPFGVELDDPHFWLEGLTIMDEMLSRLEELTTPNPINA